MHFSHQQISAFRGLILLIITEVCLSCSPPLSAENPYIRNTSIGNDTQAQVAVPDQAKKLGPSDRRPVDQWVGERFIFMVMPKEMRDLASKLLHLKMKDYEGRIGKVTEVTKSKHDALGTLWKIRLVMEDNQRAVVLDYRDGLHSGIYGIAPLMDLEDAKEKWLGKTLWSRRDYLFSYNSDTQKYGRVAIKKLSAVKVTAVVASDDSSEPVRFIVKTDSDQDGFVDLRWSGTNGEESSYGHDTLTDVFLLENPTPPAQVKPAPSERQLKQIKVGDRFIIQLLDKLASPNILRPAFNCRLYVTDPTSQKDFRSLAEASYDLVSGKQAVVGEVTSWTTVYEKYPTYTEMTRSYDVVGFKVDGYDKIVYYVGQISQLPREVALPISEWNEAQKLVGKEVWKSRNNELIMLHPIRSYYLPIGTRLLDRFVVQSVRLDDQFAGRSRDGHTGEIIEEEDTKRLINAYEDSSFEFIVKNAATGEEGHCHASIKQFLNDWYTEEPKKTHPQWSDEVWDWIRGGEPVVGMTPEQAKMVWGEPDKINKSVYEWGTNEQWVYNKKGYLYFEKDKLTSTQKSSSTSIE